MTIKLKLLAFCRRVVETRLHGAEEVIRMAQASANEESKSSAGDKYETGRAMAQLEIEKASAQLAEAQKLMQTLEHIPVTVSNVVRLGSIAYTNEGNYFLSIPAGTLILDDVTYYALSPVSPHEVCRLGERAALFDQIGRASCRERV